MPDWIKAPIAAALSAFFAFLAFALSFAISGALWVNLGAAVIAFSLSMWFLLRNSRRRLAITAAAAVCLLAAVASPTLRDKFRGTTPPEPQELVERIGRAAFPLQGVDPGSGFADLEPLGDAWRGARIVALGEATHGTSEFFRMKHRITEFLVTRMGFRHVAMELDPLLGQHVESYVQGERRENPVAELPWPWRTREVANLVEWMRRYNTPAPAEERIHFSGIDYQGARRDFRMAQNTLDLLEHSGTAARMVLWAHNAHVSSGHGQMGSYLKQALRQQIYLTGFEFHHGQFTSRFKWVRTYEAPPAGNGYYAGALARTGRPILFLDFRTMRRDPEVEAWLAQPHLGHSLQELHGLYRLNPAWVTTDESWLALFDGVIYIEQSTPAEPL